MNLKELRDALLAQAAENVTMANAISRMLGEVESEISVGAPELTWQDLQVGDIVRVTFVDGSTTVDRIARKEKNDYDGDLPIVLDTRNRWVGPETPVSASWLDASRRYVKLERVQ